MYKIVRTTSLIVLIAMIGSCRKDTEVFYGLKGRVTDADEGFGLSETEITIEKQVVQNGVYGNTYQKALITTTNSDGMYEGNWQRENFAALRLIAKKTNYITADIELNVDAFENGISETQNVELYKEAFTTFRFIHSGGVPSDRLSFTFLNANFNCNCCSNGWKTWQAASIDTSFTCRVYGNRWLKYQVQTQIGFSDSSYVDSIYCAAFSTTAHDINY
jgi:hypothetical protein